jgi:hypothetical protein
LETLENSDSEMAAALTPARSIVGNNAYGVGQTKIGS